MCRWGQRDNAAGWWWRPIRLLRRRAGLVSPALVSSTNSSSPICRKALLLLPMSSPSTCIAGLLSLSLPMKTRNKTPTAGVLTLRGGRKRGKSSRNGCGICAWNWGINWSRRRFVPPSLLPPPRPKSSKPLPRAMARRLSPRPGKQAVSLGETLCFSLTGPCAAPPIRRSLQPNSAVRLMAACVWSTRLGSASVDRVRGVCSANGMAAPRRSRAGSACCCIRSRLGLLPCSWRGLESQTASPSLHGPAAPPTG